MVGWLQQLNGLHVMVQPSTVRQHRMPRMVWHVWSSRNSHADDYVPQTISQMNPIAASSRSVAADVPLTYMPADHPPAPQRMAL